MKIDKKNSGSSKNQPPEEDGIQGVSPAADYLRALRGLGYLKSGDASAESLRRLGGLGDELAERLRLRAIEEFDMYEENSAAFGQASAIAGVGLSLLSARIRLWTAMGEATRSGRSFTDEELAFHENTIEKKAAAYDKAVADADPEAALLAVTKIDRATLLNYGLLFDDDMIAAVDRMMGGLMEGRPILLVGDKGIAKTQVAKFASSLSGYEPLILSGHGDMMDDELIGKKDQDRDDPRKLYFHEGKLIQAMRQGRPIIFDEINYVDPQVLARLQDILLLRPGQTIIVQEDGEGPLSVSPGFVVFATANEASERYRSRFTLDVALRDRFSIIRRDYPEIRLTKEPHTYIPKTMMRLALASAANGFGAIGRHTDAGEIESLARLAFVTQYLYSIPADSIPSEFKSGTSVVIDQKPIMTNCVTPRKMSEIISIAAGGNNPGVTLGALIDETLLALDEYGDANLRLARMAYRLLSVGGVSGGEAAGLSGEAIAALLEGSAARSKPRASDILGAEAYEQGDMSLLSGFENKGFMGVGEEASAPGKDADSLKGFLADEFGPPDV
ncbi:MAG: AAA family ATPase [Clostridiales Family XIII bacterium]|jgi:hypothetical protein|nr:AAA family ATPase [Clostridiales Family XIII bacterium]